MKNQRKINYFFFGMFEVNGLSEERLYHRAIPLVDRTQYVE